MNLLPQYSLQKIFQFFPEPLLLIKSDAPDFTILMCNEHFKSATGLTGRDITGKSLWLTVGQDTDSGGYQIVLDAITKAIVEKVVVELPAFRFDIKDEDGNKSDPIWWQAVYAPVLDDNGEVEYLICTPRNVTLQELDKRTIEKAKERELESNHKVTLANEELEATNEELVTTKEKHAVTNEELASINIAFSATNEELAATNEELVATIQDLTSANSELYSINEQLNLSQYQLNKLNAELEDRVKRRTQALSERELSMRNLVMTADHALLILRGEEWRIEIANPQLASLWNKSQDQIIGKTLMEVLPEIEGQPFPALLKQVYETGLSYKQSEEVLYLDSPTGQVKKFISFAYDPMFDSGGNVNGLIISAKDITDTVENRILLEQSYMQQQALNEEIIATNEEISATNEEIAVANEELVRTNEALAESQEELHNSLDLLKESEARFRHLVHQAPVAIAILSGSDLIIESANEMMLTFWGKKQDILFQPLSNALPELKGQPFLGILHDVFTSGNVYYGNEAKVTIEHGGVLKESYCNFIYQPTKDFDGKTTGIMVVAILVTEQVEAKEKLASKNEELKKAVKEFKFLADTVPIVVWTSKPNGELDYINERWYDRSDMPIENSLGSGWTTLVHPEDVPGAWAAWSHSLESGDPYQVEFRVLDKTNNYRWYLIRALPLLDEAGNILKWYGTNTDITEYKELTRQKDDFLAIASHELKTPVTSIKAYAQVIEMKLRRAGDNQNADLAAKMDKQITRLTSLIEDLLDVTKINSGKLQFNETSFDLTQLVGEVIEDIQHTTSTHHIKANFLFKGEVFGDRDRICQVLVNLLSNAIKYSPEADNVIVYTENRGKEIQVCIQDFGIGIHPDKKPHVFEQFYRVSTGEFSFQGLGLGLYISSEIIKRQGGRIWVDSNEDNGSTFCFTLPLKK